MKSRRGVSLIEMGVMMSLASTLVGISVGLLYVLIRAEGRARNDVRCGIALGRPADQFRDDVHAATDGSVSDAEGLQLHVNKTPVTVVYHIEPGYVTRTRRDGEEVRQRESFALPRGAVVSLAIDVAATPPIAALVIAPGDPVSKRVRVEPVRIEAVLARRHRFLPSRPSERPSP